MAGLSKGDRENTIYCKLFTKEPGTDEINPFIGRSKKVNDRYEIVERYSELEGVIEEMSIGKFVHKDKENTTVKVVFRDDEQNRIQLEMTFTMLAYSFLNCLASADLTSGKPVKVVVFRGINNKTGDPQAVLLMYQGPERLEWMYKWGEEIPKIEKVKVGKNLVMDDEATQEFFLSLINSILIPAVKNRQKSSPPAAPKPEDFVKEHQERNPNVGRNDFRKGSNSKDSDIPGKIENYVTNTPDNHDSSPQQDGGWNPGDDDLPF